MRKVKASHQRLLSPKDKDWELPISKSGSSPGPTKPSTARNFEEALSDLRKELRNLRVRKESPWLYFVMICHP